MIARIDPRTKVVDALRLARRLGCKLIYLPGKGVYLTK